MSYRWRDHAAAREELREAANFIEDEREGWGDRFIDAVEAALQSIIIAYAHERRRPGYWAQRLRD